MEMEMYERRMRVRDYTGGTGDSKEQRATLYFDTSCTYTSYAKILEIANYCRIEVDILQRRRINESVPGTYLKARSKMPRNVRFIWVLPKELTPRRMEGSTSRREVTEPPPLALPSSPYRTSPRKPLLLTDIDVFGAKKPNVETIRLALAKSSTAGLRTTISGLSRRCSSRTARTGVPAGGKRQSGAHGDG